jgi:hypothetical protein
MVVEALPLIPRHDVWWVGGGTVGMVVVHQLPCMAWARHGRRGLHPSVRFFGVKS